jgi:hypothetical protein
LNIDKSLIEVLHRAIRNAETPLMRPDAVKVVLTKSEQEALLTILEWALSGIRVVRIDFNRRVKVEQRLLDAASGKLPLPTAQECRELANSLGVPEEYQRGGGKDGIQALR